MDYQLAKSIVHPVRTFHFQHVDGKQPLHQTVWRYVFDVIKGMHEMTQMGYAICEHKT